MGNIKKWYWGLFDAWGKPTQRHFVMKKVENFEKDKQNVEKLWNFNNCNPKNDIYTQWHTFIWTNVLRLITPTMDASHCPHPYSPIWDRLKLNLQKSTKKCLLPTKVLDIRFIMNLSWNQNDKNKVWKVEILCEQKINLRISKTRSIFCSLCHIMKTYCCIIQTWGIICCNLCHKTFNNYCCHFWENVGASVCLPRRIAPFCPM